MVRFEQDRLVIEIDTHGNPAEYWQDLQRGLLDLLRNTNADNITDDFYIIPDFLQELIPDWETAKKM